MDVPASFQIKFLNNVEMQLQQQDNPLLGTYDEQSDTGAEKVKVKDIVGNRKTKEATDRHGRTDWEDTNFDGVWIAKPNELYDAGLVDQADQLATTISLTGAATMAAAGTINRARIQRVLEGFYGNIISGKNGTITTAFPAAQIIPQTTGAAAGATGMNTDKLIAANKLLGKAYVDKSLKKYMVLTEEDNARLLKEVPATSADFKGAFGGVFENGYLKQMLGWTFIHLELDNPSLDTIPALSTDANGYRKTPFWVKPGLRVNTWQNLRSHVGLVPELRFTNGWLMGTTLAASRTQAGMSGIILNQKG